MRAFNPGKSSNGDKQRKSNFFEHFLSKKGPSATASATPVEIQRSIKQFFMDLTYGCLTQEKYLQYLIGDTRIADIALEEANTKIIESDIIIQSMMCSASMRMPFVNSPYFMTTLNSYKMRKSVFTIISEGLAAFRNNGGDRRYLVGIAAQLNNRAYQGAKQVILNM